MPKRDLMRLSEFGTVRLAIIPANSLLISLTALLYGAIASCMVPVMAGTIPTATTAAVNNDDYSGAFAASPNKLVLSVGDIRTFEIVLPVIPSAGTTEFALTLGGTYSESTTRFTDDYRMELGFGRGANFVPASFVFPSLDLDGPLPSSPPLPTSIALFGVVPFLDLKSHGEDAIVWGGRSFLGEFSINNLFTLSIDVPDLPVSVMNHYQPGDLPPGFPPAAQAFTIRGSIVPVPEPASVVLLGFGITGLLAAAAATMRFRRCNNFLDNETGDSTDVTAVCVLAMIQWQQGDRAHVRQTFQRASTSSLPITSSDSIPAAPSAEAAALFKE